MLKTIIRILVILLVAALVAGGLYALVQNTSTNNTGFAARDRSFSPQAGSNRSEPDGFREHDREGGASLGRGLGGMLVSLLKIGVIAFIVIQVQNLVTRSRRSSLSEPA